LKYRPIELAKLVSGGYFKSPRHIELIEKLVLEAVEGKFNKLIVNIPPRHGKSEFISKYFPFWYLCNFPDRRVILVCYSSELARGFGRSVLDMFMEYGKDFGIEVNRYLRSSWRFAFKDFRGGMDCIGALGSITGKGADLLIIDDPVKNNLQVSSIKMRDRLWEWFVSTAYTRLEPNGIIVIVMTRWNDDDLCGRILKGKSYVIFGTDTVIAGSNWVVLKIPAIAESNDLLGRQKGEALWEERYSLRDLMMIKEQIGSRWFSALYQQEPQANDGKIFNRKYFQYFDDDLEFYHLFSLEKGKRSRYKMEFRIFSVCDLAISEKEHSDYTVVIVFGVNSDNDILILDVVRERFEGAKHLGLIENVFARWQPIMMGIESVQYQKSLVQSLMNKGFRICELKPREDKVSRALPMQARLEAGKVYFKMGAVWLGDFERELLEFPDSANDDQVDAFAYIAFMLNKSSVDKPISKSYHIRYSGAGVTDGF